MVALAATGTMMGTLNAGMAADSVAPASILVIDSQLIQQNSRAGKDILRQVDDIRTQVQAEIQKEESSLRSQEDELKRQRSILTPEAFDQKRQAWEQKVMAVQRKVQAKNAALQMAVKKANETLQRAIVPILQKILNKRGATFIMDKGQMVLMAPNKGLDVTTDVIEQLDTVLPDITVDFSAVKTAGEGSGGAAAAPAPAPAPKKKKN
ncbi:MAG TPA: OmpH family outer membrane protein [Alphaproteobacteria bacterium]|nr:OmpH family outer membrane protein [Alphaproteobacteria bacterium]